MSLAVIDAAYVALAERVTGTLATADRRLASASGPRCPIDVIDRPGAPRGRGRERLPASSAAEHRPGISCGAERTDRLTSSSESTEFERGQQVFTL